MMKANYHTHTWRCNHAEPDERAYVQAALDTGLKVLGFSDHSPYPFDDGYCSGFRMRCDQTAEYIRTIAALRDEYRGDIDIHIGFEAEYYPRYFGRLLEMLEPTEYEYLILGQHFLGNELDSQPNFEETDDPARLRQSLPSAQYIKCVIGRRIHDHLQEPSVQASFFRKHKVTRRQQKQQRTQSGIDQKSNRCHDHHNQIHALYLLFLVVLQFYSYSCFNVSILSK